MAKATALKVSVAIVAAVAIALVGVLVGTRLGSDKAEGSVATTEYWQTQPGKLDMQSQARNAISDLAVRRGGIASGFGETKYGQLTVIMSADITQKGETARLWFKVSFAAGEDSVMRLGEPESALTEAEL
ncbi:hypothetical protein [Nocardia vulneris]|uniref:Uncharacterized protein n=1 Tax=Nocardia vulneris TaxID=1141657 RepID=A0ABR4Z2U9_9NOCA|nr:hypothetical protein [Nocardia vulneris]KIA59633.1 hypothetical protein FG87_41850 [Nocardia vulneris]